VQHGRQHYRIPLASAKQKFPRVCFFLKSAFDIGCRLR